MFPNDLNQCQLKIFLRKHLKNRSFRVNSSRFAFGGGWYPMPWCQSLSVSRKITFKMRIHRIEMQICWVECGLKPQPQEVISFHSVSFFRDCFASRQTPRNVDYPLQASFTCLSLLYIAFNVCFRFTYLRLFIELFVFIYCSRRARNKRKTNQTKNEQTKMNLIRALEGMPTIKKHLITLH